MYNPVFREFKHAMRFGGGGSGAAARIEAAPIPTPAPPVTSSSAEVIQAEQDYAQQNLMKKSVKKTIMAGDTGGFSPTQPNVAGTPNPSTGFKRYS